MPSPKKKTTKKKTAKRRQGTPQTDVHSLFSEDTINLSVYGRSGTGKTTFWSTFPGPIRVFLFSGIANPGELKSIALEDRHKVTPVVFDSIDEFSELLNTKEGYTTNVLDHATGLQDVVLRDVLGINEIPVQMKWGTATQQQWGEVAIKMKELVRGFLNLPGNCVIVSQERTFNTDTESDLITPTIGPAMSPSIAGWLNASTDYIVQTYLETTKEKRTNKVAGKEINTTVDTGEIEYRLRTKPHPVYTTKFRVPRGSTLPEYLVDPTYEDVLSVINGEYIAN